MGIVRLITPRGTTGCGAILSLMKNVNLALEDACPSVYPKTKLTAFATLLGFALILAGQSQAANLLINSSFETNQNSHIIPQGWTRFAPPTAAAFGNYWCEGAVTPHSGVSYFKEWGACYNGTNNVAGIYQDFSSAPGSAYQASGWCYTRGTDALNPDCYTWFEVAFFGASSNLLALYKSDPFSASLGTDTWLPFQVNKACDVSSSVSVGDPFFTTYAVTGTVSQLVAPIGTTTVRFRYAYLQFASEGGSAYIDDCVLNQVSGPIPPVVNNLFPLNMIFVNPNDGLSFNVTSPSGFTINNNAIRVIANGSNVSSGLSISGSASSKNVSWSGLQSNTTYTVSITATDSFGFSVSANTYFETTWVGTPPVVYLWEAEDFDFTNGLYINNPALCSVPNNPNCYFGKVGVEGVDEHATGTAPGHLYRPDDAIGTVASGDYSRKDHLTGGVLDYRIDPFNGDPSFGGSWLNYTRDWPAGTYWIIGRLSTDIGLNGQLMLSVVTPTSTNDLGTFTINGGHGWSSFQNVYLLDTNNNIAPITLSGKQTLRITSGGNLLPNFFTLVAGQVDLPQLLNLYPTGSHPFEYTNALSFTIRTLGATFPANSIKVFLDGADVSSLLTITGSASSNNVVFPYLQRNAMHTVLITATNSLGHGISVSNSFDTFNEANYMVEAEDFDYGGGQYIDPWFPEAYSGLDGTTNIDFVHTSITGEQFQYNRVGIPQETSQDYVRSFFVGSFDYHLAFFQPTDWANYTRAYPSGAFYVYGRFAGSGDCSMYLDQVTSGAGTANQVTKRLGHFHNFGRGYQTHDWVPLTDDGLAAPAVVKLGGVGTLRLSSGTFNPNYLMFVPAGGISLKATRSGSNILISFPTQSGVVYRVFYRTDIASGNWTLLTSVLGDGTTKSATDSTSSSPRFYKVVSP
jgi:hypothetical protein